MKMLTLSQNCPIKSTKNTHKHENAISLQGVGSLFAVHEMNA